MNYALQEPQPGDSRPGHRRGRSRRRTWLFRGASIGLALLPFVLIEVVLRTCGVGHDTTLVVPYPAPQAAGVARLNPAADRIYYGVEDLWGPDPRPFQLDKPDGTFRVVVIGGSTVAGFPFPFELALPKQLEVVLTAQVPDRKFEVLNVGMTAITSSHEVHNLAQSLACRPDLIVVHTGHNEFYGPGGSASTANRLTSRIPSLTRFIKRQRSFQLLLSLAQRPTSSHLVSTLPADIGIPLDGPLFEFTQQRFRTNLESMADAARDAGIPIVFSTVPSNLRDMAPLQPTAREATLARLTEIDRLMSYREYASAWKTITDARREAPVDALLTYRAAQCLEELGRATEAAQAYRLAADLDGCRLRAATPMLDVVGEVARSRQPGVFYCDVAAKLQDRSQLAAPGADFFLEHVHYNLEGTWQVATILAESIVTDVLGATWDQGRVPDAERRDELLGATSLDRLAADSLTVVLFDAWPFTLSPARDAERRSVGARLTDRFQAMDAGQREQFANLGLDAMHQHLWLAMGNAWLAAGDAEASANALARHIRRRPWEAAGYEAAARALAAQGKQGEAAAMRQRADELKQGIRLLSAR